MHIDLLLTSEHYKRSYYSFMAEKLSGSNTVDIPLLLDRYARVDLERLKISPIFAGESVPHGKGEHVVIIPGLNESDKELIYLKQFLEIIGYVPESSGIGFNFGLPWQAYRAGLTIHSMKKNFGQVSVVGHSLGGFMGVQIAQSDETVNKVVALGAPYLNALRPTTETIIESIYSPADGVVPEVTSYLQGPHTKNVRVENPNHFALLCHTETFREIAFALAS